MHLNLLYYPKEKQRMEKKIQQLFRIRKEVHILLKPACQILDIMHDIIHHLAT